MKILKIKRSLVFYSCSDVSESKINYLLYADENLPFVIDPKTGEISTNGTLDLEMIESYSFPVFVSDTGVPVYTSSATVFINVLDVNDNPPQFAAPVLVALVKEDHSNPQQHQILDVVSL